LRPHLIFLVAHAPVLKPVNLSIMIENLDNYERREYARVLYVKASHTIKETAAAANVDEATIRQWIAEDAWDEQKRVQLVSKPTQISNFYAAIQALQNKIDNDPANAAAKDVDTIVKYTNAIKNLEADVTACQVMEVCDLFMRWLRKKDLILAKTMIPKFNGFIKSYLTK
jgi:Phage terminase small subunit